MFIYLQVSELTIIIKVEVQLKNVFFFTDKLGESSKKNSEKAVRLTAWVDPTPLPRSGQENVKNSRQVVIFGVILPFYKGQNGSKFSQKRSGQADRFFSVSFFDAFP